MDNNKRITMTFSRAEWVTLMNAASFGCALSCLSDDENLEGLLAIGEDVGKHIRHFGVERWNSMMIRIADTVQAKQQLWLDTNNEPIKPDTSKPWEN